MYLHTRANPQVELYYPHKFSLNDNYYNFKKENNQKTSTQVKLYYPHKTFIKRQLLLKDNYYNLKMENNKKTSTQRQTRK